MGRVPCVRVHGADATTAIAISPSPSDRWTTKACGWGAGGWPRPGLLRWERAFKLPQRDRPSAIGTTTSTRELLEHALHVVEAALHPSHLIAK